MNRQMIIIGPPLAIFKAGEEIACRTSNLVFKKSEGSIEGRAMTCCCC